MLTMTSSAAEVVNTVREEKGVPESFGLRVYPEPSPQGVHVQLALAPEPAEGDQIIEAEGQSLFVDSELAEPLADAVIDAEETPDGRGLVFRGLENA